MNCRTVYGKFVSFTGLRIAATAMWLSLGSLMFLTCAENEGRDLAQKHCGACHRFPEPALLDKSTWQDKVFPEMALRMGLDVARLPGADAAELSEILQALPPEPLVSQEEMQAMLDYYLREAPQALETSPQNYPRLEQFEDTTVSLPVNGRASITLFRAHPFSRTYFAGTREGKLFILSPKFAVVDSVSLPSPPSAISFDSTGILAACMGIMDPNDQRKGAVIMVKADTFSVLVDGLKRPVHIEQADLNRDGRKELLVSSFGNFSGGLSLFEQRGDNTYVEHELHRFPGNRKTITGDFNGDGLRDIMALLTQGDERIILLTNRGNFRFSFQVLLRFPPVYGSSYFDLVDFDDDGDQDILYTNGDNADYSPILKPFHGVRLYLNDGKNHFSESWFHPMHGASMAKAHDFDGDGDRDIAAISFFPDFNRTPENGFLYFRNDGDRFTAFSTPLAASSRWITMETEDIDNDGDRDIVLGALAFATGVPDSLFSAWIETRTSLLVLRNKLR